MKRVAELIIIISTLAAIVSTFFLYRSHTFSPQLTASVIESEMPDSEETVREDVQRIERTSTATSSSEAEPEEPQSETITSVIEKSIVIEKLPITVSEVETLSSGVHSLTNLSRSQNNLPKYTLDSKLSAIAQKRSDEMISENYFSHTSPSGCNISCEIKKSGYPTMSWGENLALTNDYHLYTSSELAQTFIADWLKSSTHRDNLLSREFTHHGIGIASKGQRIVITVVFAVK